MRTLAVAAALMVVGCGYETPQDGGEPWREEITHVDWAGYAPRPGEAEAIEVLKSVFGREIGPVLVKYEDPSPECTGMDAGKFLYDGKCYAGLQDWVGSTPRARVMWGPTHTFGRSVFAHELCHVVFGDSGHQQECSDRQGSMSLAGWTALRNAGL